MQQVKKLNVTKLKKIYLYIYNSTNQNVTTRMLKMWQNWKKNHIITKTLKFLKNQKNQILTIKIVTKLKKLKLWQNSKSQMVTKLKNSSVTNPKTWNGTEKKLKIKLSVKKITRKTQIVTTQNLWDFFFNFLA